MLYDAAFERAEGSPDISGEIAADFAALGRSIERIGELTRHGRLHDPPGANPRDRVQRAIDFAAEGLRATDADVFGRRETIHSFDKSPGEKIYAALLIAGYRLRRLTEKVATVAPDIHTNLLAHSVVQQYPVNEETLKPIA